MPVKKFRPVTPTQRYKTVNSYEELTTNTPQKALLGSRSRSGGRNNHGRMTMRRRGGGHKRRYRVIDFKRDKRGIPGKVSTVEYDPNRSAFIALITYADGDKRYILAPNGLQVGSQVMAGPDAPIQVGNCLPLSRIPLGSTVHNVELSPGHGGQLARSAGAQVQFLARDEGRAVLRLPRVSPGRSPRRAWRPWGRWATSNTATSCLVKQVGPGGSAVVQRCVVWS